MGGGQGRFPNNARCLSCNGLGLATTTYIDGACCGGMDGWAVVHCSLHVVLIVLTELSTSRPGDNADCEAQCSSTCQRTTYVANSDFGYTCNTTLSSTK